MKKCFHRITAVLTLCSILALSAVVYGNLTIPDTVQVISDQDAYLPALYSQSEQNIRFLHSIAVKQSEVTTSKRIYAEPLGNAFGIKLYTEGVMVVRTDSVDTPQGSVSPAQTAGIREGDMILAVNGRRIQTNRQLASSIAESAGKDLHLRMRRESTAFDTVLVPVQSSLDGQYRAGIWVRDSSAGIGTMSFFVPEYGMFAGLGHAVCDIDTGKLLPLGNGEAVDVSITGSYKGRGGSPGELCGVFTGSGTGKLLGNTESGIYGMYDSSSNAAQMLPVAMYYEVNPGKATILCEVDASGTHAYDVEITKLFSNPDAKQKNLVVKVTDPELIEKTGGIVQGMSGSPILQNGMIVGVVTHVFVQDPLQGFGIYAQTMVRQMQQFKENAAA